jgi:transformation/transcription domain-associated protein
MGQVMASFMQVQRAATPNETLGPAFEVIALESPAQQTARENHEAMGGFWSGMSPTIQNPTAYSDFLSAQAKVIFFDIFPAQFTHRIIDTLLPDIRYALGR